MIVRAASTDWCCPNCGHASDSSSESVSIYAVCRDCGFHYPRPSDHESSFSCPDDETWTEKWGPIRTDRYRVIRALPGGAQGRILLAQHRHLNQRCVIKLVATQDDHWTEVANQRLQNEAQSGVLVNHANVARVYDCDCLDKAWYFVMEYIEGDNLRRLLEHVRRFRWEQVANIGKQVSAGLSAIHDADLIHRDIKPSNIMLSYQGVAKIMDLGLVKMPTQEDAHTVTWAGQVLGTPLYMPPEQFEASESLDHRADIYALGATLYQLLVGKPPFEGRGIDELAQNHREAAVTWPEDVVAEAPVWLRECIEHCLAKRREHRFARARDLLDLLEQNRSVVPRPQQIHHQPAVGIVVMSFRNLSRRTDDDWIGDAIAECLTSRLMELQNARVGDRAVLAKIMQRQIESSTPHQEDTSRAQLLEATRVLGLTHVVTGSFQRQGDDLRLMGSVLWRDKGESQFAGAVSGKVEALFQLEDELAEAVIRSLQSVLQSDVREDRAARPANLVAHEKYVRGLRAFSDGDYEMAIRFAHEAFERDSEYGEPLSLIGACFARKGEYDRAVEYHEKQERLARQHGNTGEQAASLSNLGATYYYMGEYAVAYGFLERAASWAEKIQPPDEAAKLYGNLGMVLMRLGRLSDAEGAFEKAISICKAQANLVAMVWPYNGMGSVLFKQGRFVEAMEYHERALHLAEEVADRVMVGVSQMNLGRCATKLDRLEQAEIWFHSALGTLESTGFWNGLALVHEYMADMYIQQQRLAEAMATVDHRIDVTHRHGNRRMEAQAWEQKAKIFELSESTSDALQALKRSLEISQQPAPCESLHRYLHDVTSRSDAYPK